MESQQVINVDPKLIFRPKQVRTAFQQQPIEELKQSIRSVGILQPVLLRRQDDRLICVDGERRVRAAIELEMNAVPAIIGDLPLDDAEVVQRQLIANCVREDLSPLETAAAIQQMMTMASCTAAEVSARIGKSPATISRLLALLSAPIEVRERIAAGEIGIKAAYEMVRGTGATELLPPGAPSAGTAGRRTKLTAFLDHSHSVVVHGIDSTIDSMIDLLDQLLARTKAARKQGIELPTFLAMLRDQAGK